MPQLSRAWRSSPGLASSVHRFRACGRTIVSFHCRANACTRPSSRRSSHGVGWRADGTGSHPGAASPPGASTPVEPSREAPTSTCCPPIT